MKPYFSNALTSIYHGDCLEVLKSLSIEAHAVITDVPYASGARTEAKKSTSGSMVRGERWASSPIENDQMTTTGFVWFLREMCYAAKPLLVEGGSFITFIDWRQWPNLVGAIETTNLRVNQMIVWDKQSYGMGNGFRAQHELIVHASKGTPRIVDRGVGNVLRCKRDSNELHPSPKPPGLMQQLIKVVAGAGDLIVDPCMGSGSPLVGAQELRVRSIGIEAEEQHCENAAKRLSQTILALA